MNGAVNRKRKRWVGRAVFGLLGAGLAWFSGSGQAAPEIRWAKTYTPRVWTYASGTRVTAAYVSYQNGNVYVIEEGNAKESIALQKLSAEDQAWVLNELKKPHGLIADVIFGQWQDQSPRFWVKGSFFTKGNLAESPVVCVQYLFLNRQNCAVKRICSPAALYPTVGKQTLEQMSPTVMSQCLGPQEPDISGVKMLAYQAVMLLLHDNKKEWLVLDTLAKQNDGRLRELGIPSDWGDSRYPVGVWPAPIAGGGKK